ncbi:MAG TPA: GlsB/YeaQ/YmgE family stress response membrane protein [Rhizomicrobium sp.]|nr:GlsB/YeaQ/YmgE family stress response membrane protein [Rhizomicrobium sp.]
MIVLGWIVFGAFVGWLASWIMGKEGSGCMVNIALGLVGALAGGFLFRALGGGFSYEAHGLIVSTLVAVIGAVIVLAVWNALTGHRPLR